MIIIVFFSLVSVLCSWEEVGMILSKNIVYISSYSYL